MADLKAADLRDRILDVLVVLVVGLRPLITDSVSASLPGLFWYGLLALALGLAATTGRSLAHGPAGWVGALVVALFLPAAWSGPDGYEAWALWGQWGGHLALAILIALVGWDRRALCLGALIGGFSIETVYALGQQTWVLPHLADLARQGAIDVGNLQGDLLARIDQGGVFGSFLLSNALAAFLILVLPLGIGVLDRRTPLHARWSIALISLLGLIVLVLTRSKGAWLAAIAAAGIVAVVHLHGRRRWIVAAVGVLALGIVLATPALRDLGAASADVRWGYWQAAAALISEAPLTGHGLGGFAAEAARVLPIGAEYSRYAHNEVLDAAVAAGLLAGIAVLVWLALISRRPRTLVPADAASPAALIVILPIALAVPYLHVFGLLALEGWPGATHGLHLFAALGLGLIGGCAAWAGSRLRPPDWALHLGLVALIIHCLIDFDLHHGGIVGPLVVLAVLGGSRFQAAPRIGRGIAGIAAIAIVVALATFGVRGRAIENAQAAVDEVLALPRLAQEDPRRFTERVSVLFADQGLDLPRGPLRPADLDRLLQATGTQALTVMAMPPPAAPSQQAAILRALPAGAERRPLSQALADAAPGLPRAQRCLAEDLAAEGDLAGAIAAARRAVAAAPWNLPHRKALADLLDRAGDCEAAAAERATIADLAPKVHFRDRLQEEP